MTAEAEPVIGHRWLYVSAVVIFTVGSLGASPSMRDALAAAYVEALTPSILGLVPILVLAVVMCLIFRADAVDTDSVTPTETQVVPIIGSQ